MISLLLTKRVAVMCLYRRPHRLASAHLSGSVRIRANLFVDEGDQTTDVANVDQGIIVLKVENISAKYTMRKK